MQHSREGGDTERNQVSDYVQRWRERKKRKKERDGRKEQINRKGGGGETESETEVLKYTLYN